MSERRLADPPQGQRRNGDAKLGRGKVGVELVHGAQQRRGVPPPVGDHFGDSAAADSDEGEFGGDEKAVRNDENKDRYDPDKVGQSTAIAVRHDLPLAYRPAEAAER